MIYVLYTAPCSYDPRQRGFAEAEIGYSGENPVTTAERYVRRIPRARLYAVVVNGHIWFQ